MMKKYDSWYLTTSCLSHETRWAILYAVIARFFGTWTIKGSVRLFPVGWPLNCHDYIPFLPAKKSDWEFLLHELSTNEPSFSCFFSPLTQVEINICHRHSECHALVVDRWYVELPTRKSPSLSLFSLKQFILFSLHLRLYSYCAAFDWCWNRTVLYVWHCCEEGSRNLAPEVGFVTPVDNVYCRLTRLYQCFYCLGSYLDEF